MFVMHYLILIYSPCASNGRARILLSEALQKKNTVRESWDYLHKMLREVKEAEHTNWDEEPLIKSKTWKWRKRGESQN